MLSEAESAEKSDEDLAELVLTDREAYRFLMRRYESRLLAYVRRLTSLRSEDAADILQEVFIKAYLNLNSFDRHYKFSSWIYRIAHNEAVSHWRRTKSQPQPLPTEDDDTATDTINRLSVDPDMAGQIDRQTSADTLRAAVAKLDEHYRDVLVLRYFEDKSYAEMSEILRKPLGTVATLISRAKESLRKEMKRQQPAGKEL